MKKSMPMVPMARQSKKLKGTCMEIKENPRSSLTKQQKHYKITENQRKSKGPKEINRIYENQRTSKEI